MAHTQVPVAGGEFLTTAVNPNDVYVREDLTEEQRLFGQTAAEFMRKEVLPVVERLYKHDWALTRQLLKKASDLDLLRLEIPAEYGGLLAPILAGQSDVVYGSRFLKPVTRIAWRTRAGNRLREMSAMQ